MTVPLRAAPDEDPGRVAKLRQTSDFEEFFRAEHTTLFRALCLVTRDRPEAEEIMQDAFLRVWERWDRISSMDDPRGYLYRVAMNGFRSRYRSATRAMKRTVRTSEPDDAYTSIEDRDIVIRALRELTPAQRAAVVLTSLLDYSSDEAGRMLGMRPSHVRTAATRARSAMRRTIGELS